MVVPSPTHVSLEKGKEKLVEDSEEEVPSDELEVLFQSDASSPQSIGPSINPDDYVVVEDDEDTEEEEDEEEPLFIRRRRVVQEREEVTPEGGSLVVDAQQSTLGAKQSVVETEEGPVLESEIVSTLSPVREKGEDQERLPSPPPEPSSPVLASPLSDLASLGLVVGAGSLEEIDEAAAKKTERLFGIFKSPSDAGSKRQRD